MFKNKVAPPFKKVEMDLMFGKGISYIGSILDASIKYDLIEKSGSWYAYNDEKIGQGKDNATNFLEANPEIVELLDSQLRAIMFPKTEDKKVEGKSEKKEILIN